MAWHKLTNTGGDIQYVASLDGIDVEEWTALSIVQDRYPNPHAGEEIDASGNIFTPLQWLKDQKLAAVKQAQAERFAMGWTHDFGGTIGEHVLDMRDADDKGNWTLLLIKTNGMIAAGGGAVPVKIRTAFNEEIFVSATDANTAMIQFLAWGEAMLVRKWELDASITAATTADDPALAIDVTTGWPT